MSKKLSNSHGCLQVELEPKLTGELAPYMYSLNVYITKSPQTPATMTICHYNNHKGNGK